MVEILKQNQYVPMSVSNQIAIIYASVNGYLDDVAIENINKYESELMEFLAANNQSTLDTITSTGKIDDEAKKDLDKALESFSKTFKD